MIASVFGNVRQDGCHRDVTIARDNGNFVEIASGLSAGDKVALNISSQIVDGDRVTVKEDTKTAAAQ